MNFPVSSLLPELTLCGGLLLLLLTPFFEKRTADGSSCTSCATCSGKIAFVMTQAVLWLAVFFVFSQGAGTGEARLTMQALLLRSPLTQTLQAAALIATSVALFYAWACLARDKLLNAETFILLLCTVLGVMTVISATHLILIYLGIELMSLPLYAMVALRKKHLPAAESALKYFFLGALASGLLLYGFSLIYAATGAMSIFDIGRLMAAGSATTGSTTLFKLGLIFVLAGLMFKLSVVPFHMWAPDVYQGAPTFITLYISTVPKFAAAILLIRLLSGPLSSLVIYWQSVLVVLAGLSMILGAVAAIVQTNIKRMLAYSTIGHMGYLLLGVLTGDTAGYSASLFYVLVYAITNLVAFGVLLSMATQEKDNDELNDFRGLYRRSPLRALLMGAAMFSLAGVPPFVGFFGKFVVIEIAFNNGFFWLSIIAILTSVIAAFYYLRVVLFMFFTDAETSAAKQFLTTPLSMVLLSGNGLALLALGIFPNAILGWLAYIIARAPVF